MHEISVTCPYCDGKGCKKCTQGNLIFKIKEPDRLDVLQIKIATDELFGGANVHNKMLLESENYRRSALGEDYENLSPKEQNERITETLKKENDKYVDLMTYIKIRDNLTQIYHIAELEHLLIEPPINIRQIKGLELEKANKFFNILYDKFSEVVRPFRTKTNGVSKEVS